MPLIKVNYPKSTKFRSIESLSVRITTEVASILNKSMDYVMVIFESSEFQSFGGDGGTLSLYLEVKNVGIISPSISVKLTESLTRILEEGCGIDPRRLYIEFSNCERHMWAWNGKTFA